MKKTIVLCLVLMAALANTVHANPGYAKGETIVCGHDCRPGGGGGDVPFPFIEANQLFELADGSPYNLYGTIVIAPSTDGSGDWIAYLKVDLKKHDWLSNERRQADSRYPLLGSTRFWRQFDGAYVRLGGHAQTEIVWHQKSGLPKQEVLLAASIFRIEKLPASCQ
jgi:hypothetical protein